MNKRLFPIREFKNINHDMINNYVNSIEDNLNIHSNILEEIEASLKRTSNSIIEDKHYSLFTNRILNYTQNIAFNNSYSSDMKDSFRPLTRYIRDEIQTIFKKIDSSDKIINSINMDDVADQINMFIKENLLADLLVFELNNASKADILIGDTPQQRFSYYINHLTNTYEWIDYIFSEYPVLIYKLYHLITNINSSISEWVDNFMSDYEDINKTFLDNGKIINLNGLRLFLSDLHNSGKSVYFVELNSKTIVYKPKSISLEGVFKHTIDWFNAKGAGIDIKFPLLIVKINYGWMEFIGNKDCSTINEAKAFYITQGKLLAVFYLLGSSDILDDNLIAHIDQPCFIDLEALITKKILNNLIPKEVNSGLKKKILFNSVTKSHMLPRWSIGDDYQQSNLSGGLILTTWDSSFPTIKIWGNKGSDEMKKVVVPIKDVNIKHKKSHLPSLNGKPIEIDNYIEDFISGFTEMYQLIFSNRHLLLNDDLSPFKLLKGQKVRVILRDTSIYSHLIKESINPLSLSDFNINDLIFEHLWVSKSNILDENIILNEIDQLNRFDIPFFYSYEDDPYIYSIKGEKISNKPYFYNSCIEGIKTQLREFEEKDLQTQLSVIRSSFNLYLDQKNSSVGIQKESYVSCSINQADTLITPREKTDIFLEVAKKMGDEILSMSSNYEGEIGWVSETFNESTSKNEVGLLNNGLYDGDVGIAVFFNLLYTHSYDDKYLKIAQNIINRSLQNLNYSNDTSNLSFYEKSKKHIQSLDAFSYPLNLLYLASSINSIEYMDVKLQINDYIERDLFRQAHSFDFLTGITGIINLLLDAYINLSDVQLLEYAKLYCDKLIKNATIINKEMAAWPYEMSYSPTNKKILYLGGFSHGTAGIAYVLAKSAKIFKSDIYSEYAKKALNYDRYTYSKKANGWLDLRDEDNVSSALFWCHGAAGIGLSRLLINELQTEEDKYLYDEINIAKNIIINRGLGHNQSLCHGDMGNLEILYSMAKAQNNQKLQQKVLKYLLSISKQYLYDNKKVKLGGPNRTSAIGLFKGLSGIAYNFIRFYDWENTPSLLILENRNLSCKVLH